MANVTESAEWLDGIYQLEQSDPVLGGPGGIANRQAEQLGSRTLYLKEQIEQAGSDLAGHVAAEDPHPQYATELWVAAQVAALINSAPGALDTLAELAAALGNDANFAATLTASLAGKVALSDKASTAQAQAGTDDLTWMTPLKTKQAITALSSTVGSATEAAAGTVELATNTETITGTDNVRATHPAGVKAAIQAAITALVNELAVALGNDANFAATMTAALAGKVPLNGALGTPTSGNVGSCTVDGTNTVGFRAIPQTSQAVAYTCVMADAGKHVYQSAAATITIPANAAVAYPIGTAITFVSGASQISIAITTDTLRLAGDGTTGTRTLSAYGMATAVKISATEWRISGAGLS